MKKRKSSGGANWMDTYGDMVTLLLCFFVLLYSMSSISEENFKALVMSFNPQAVLDLRATPDGGKGPSADGDKSGVAPVPDTDAMQIEADIEELFQAFQAMAAQGGSAEVVSVSKDGGKIYVSFDGEAFFAGESSQLRESALPVLDEMCEMLTKVAGSLDEVRVIGHTAQLDPNRPNNPWRDRELSGARAARVVTYIQEHTDSSVLDPAKLANEGRGQWQPVSDNDSEEGRAKNRRVEMIISGREVAEQMGDSVPSYTTD